MKSRQPKSEHWTKLIRGMMQTPAWRALPPTAQALYPWLKFEWHGPQNNNNGMIRLSIRQAAERLGVQSNTAARAFHELQAKGFLVVKTMACLGSSGEAKSPAYELTELPLAQSEKLEGTKLYRDWRPGHDYPVLKAAANNPRGRNGKTESHLKNEDRDVIKMKTFRQNTSSK